MKNIILQHFTGKLRELDKLSIENIKEYAKRIGAEYRFIEGQVFRKHLTPPCQKVFLLDESFDEYDNVLMLDIDMFTTKGLTENVFETEKGIGLFVDVQKRLREKLTAHGRIKIDSAYWAGSFYKMDRNTRQSLRKQIPKENRWMDLYNKPYYFEDEGIIAELYHKAGLPKENINIKRKWCQCSFLPNLTEGFIHIRTKITPKGPKREKIVNYNDLVKKGII